MTPRPVQRYRISISENGVPYTGSYVVENGRLDLTTPWGSRARSVDVHVPSVIIARSLLREVVLDAKARGDL